LWAILTSLDKEEKVVICRCHNHAGAELVKLGYIFSVHPIGYPDTAVICGIKGCQCPALVWLKKEDLAAYQASKRIFDIPNQALKVKTI
jgi:hypothetical protein